MSDDMAHVAFTKAVRDEQEKQGSRRGYARMDEKGAWNRTVSSKWAHSVSPNWRV